MIQPIDFFNIAQEALTLAIVLSLPILGAAFLAGLLSTVLQMFTRVSEPALTHVPRIVAVGLAALIAAPWIGGRVADFSMRVWSMVQTVGL